MMHTAYNIQLNALVESVQRSLDNKQRVPPTPDELARILFVLLWAKPLTFGDLVLENYPVQRVVRRIPTGDGGSDVTALLTSIEGGSRHYHVLRLLMQANGDFVSIDDCVRAVWQREPGEVRSNVVNVTISVLRKKLEAAGSQVTIVAKRNGGFALADPAPAITTLEELHSVWESKFSATVARMFRALLTMSGPTFEWVTKADLAAAVGVSHTTGTFSNQLRELATPGVIEAPPRSAHVRLTPLVYPEGLR